MKKLLFILFTIPFILYAQPQEANYSEFTTSTQYGSLSNYPDYEEVGFLHPNSPGKIEKLYVALNGNVAKNDTIRIIGDPSDGLYAASIWVHGALTYNLYAQFVVSYKPGQNSWVELDVSGLDIKVGGLDRIGISHIIKEGGPYFLADGDKSKKGLSSWVVQSFKPNPQFYNIRGTALQFDGDFLLAAKIDWDLDSENSPPPAPTLVDVTEQAGLKNLSGEPLKSSMGSVYDWNNDGFDDININSNFFENNGDGTFTNVSSDFSGIESGYKIFADIDNDGFTDIFVAKGGGNDKIYYGSDNGYVEETDPIFGGNSAPTTTPLFLDYNNDGQMDIFIARGRATIDGKEVYYQDQLFLNKGNRKFEDVTVAAGIEAGEPGDNFDCWGASVTDYNQDGLSDIFVATYRLAPDLLYKNNGDGTFTEVAASTGVIGNPTLAPNYYGHGMGSDWGDFDKDGDFDLVVGNLGHPDERGASSNPSLIFINEENSFVEKHQELGLKFFEMNSGPIWVDLNNDGYLDLWSSQYSYDKKEVATRNKYSRVYINEGALQDFALTDITWISGARIHGAWAPLKIDFDLDGDMDLLVCSSLENVKLFENRLPNIGNSINFRIDNKKDGALGVKAILNDNNGEKIVVQNQGIISTGRTSQSTNMFHFGIGKEPKQRTITATRNNGSEHILDNLYENCNYWLDGNGELKPLDDVHLISPLDQKLVQRSDYLRWRPLWNVESLNLTISSYPEGNILMDMTMPYSKDIQISELGNLQEGVTYGWKLKAIGRQTATDYSETGSFIIDKPANVKEDMNNVELSVFPNPAQSTMEVTISTDQNELLGIKLLDLAGKTVTDYGSKIIGGELNFQLQISDIPSGSYLLVISDKEGRNKATKVNIIK